MRCIMQVFKSGHGIKPDGTYDLSYFIVILIQIIKNLLNLEDIGVYSLGIVC